MNLSINNILLFLFIYANSLLSQGYDTFNSPITKLNDSEYKLGKLLLDTNLKEIKIPGKINMQKGLIEVFACSPGGKLHESLIVSEIVPYNLQVALLLLGLDPVDKAVFENGENLEKYSKLEIWVKWNVDGIEKKYRAEDIIWNEKDDTTMQRTNWIFRGSMIIDGNFIANEIKSLITTYNDPTTIIDNPLISGKNDELYYVNSNVVPPMGTDVEVIISIQ